MKNLISGFQVANKKAKQNKKENRKKEDIKVGLKRREKLRF
jgi:hypothetical protein